MEYPEKADTIADCIKRLAWEAEQLPYALQTEHTTLVVVMRAIGLEKHLYELLEKLEKMSRELHRDGNHAYADKIFDRKELTSLKYMYEAKHGTDG